MVHVQILAYAYNQFINKYIIEDAWNSALERYQLLMSLYSQGVKSLMADSSENITKKLEAVDDFILRCQSIKYNVIDRIWELVHRYNEVDLYIFRYSLWIEYHGEIERMISDEDDITLRIWNNEASENEITRFNLNIKIVDNRISEIQIVAMLMNLISNLYFNVQQFIDRAYYQTDFIDDDEREELIYKLDIFMRTVTVNLISMAKSLFKYIHELIEPVIIYTNGLSISAISKNMQPLILYNQYII